MSDLRIPLEGDEAPIGLQDQMVGNTGPLLRAFSFQIQNALREVAEAHNALVDRIEACDACTAGEGPTALPDGLDEATIEILEDEGITTLEQLQDLSEEELRAIDGIGPARYEDIAEVLS